MQSVEWTDGKLEERLERLDERFGTMTQQRYEDREWAKHRFDQVDQAIEEIKHEMKALQVTLQRGNFALVTSIFGVLVATILKG